MDAVLLISPGKPDDLRFTSQIAEAPMARDQERTPAKRDHSEEHRNRCRSLDATAARPLRWHVSRSAPGQKPVPSFPRSAIVLGEEAESSSMPALAAVGSPLHESATDKALCAGQPAIRPVEHAAAAHLTACMAKQHSRSSGQHRKVRSQRLFFAFDNQRCLHPQQQQHKVASATCSEPAEPSGGCIPRQQPELLRECLEQIGLDDPEKGVATAHTVAATSLCQQVVLRIGP